MSSFLSRLYSILLPDSITYDSRVAATMGLFIREFCVLHKINLPEELCLIRLQGWGKDKKENGRNAGWGTNEFPSIDKIKKRWNLLKIGTVFRNEWDSKLLRGGTL